MTDTTRRSTIDVAVVGLGFGAAFVPLYMNHPAVGRVAICDPDRRKLDEFGDRYGVDDRFESLDELFASEDYDAVHLVTPVTLHAEQAVAVLGSGRHCASAVPMGLSIDEIDAVVRAAADSGKRYMMMETAVYQREYLLAAHLRDTGGLGTIGFLRGVHIRDRTEMPLYWRGFPPMKYATHAISPLLAIADRSAGAVHAFGSGTLASANEGAYGNPFPLETAIFSLVDSDVKMEITQGCFQTARPAQEGFSVYGDRMSLEWPQAGEERVQIYTMHDGAEQEGSRFRRVDQAVTEAPDMLKGLPVELAPFTRDSTWAPPDGREPIMVHGHHSGSHPHLVHEFISSIVEDRRSRVDEFTAAAWCAPGICAHESALRGGERIDIPRYTRPENENENENDRRSSSPHDMRERP